MKGKQVIINGVLKKHYFVNESGDIYSTKKSGQRTDKGDNRHYAFRKLDPGIAGNGYKMIRFNKQERHYYVHEVVLEAFDRRRPRGLFGLHKDDDKLNNHISNLYWGTSKQNCADAKRNGKRVILRGVDKPACKLTKQAVVDIFTAKKYYGYLVDLSAKYNISKQVILDIRNRKAWRHITNNLKNG